MKNQLITKNMEEKLYNEIADFLESRGYEFVKDKDGFWFEDYIIDHKWKEVFELMHLYAEHKNKPK